MWHAIMRPAKHLRQKHPLYGKARHQLSEIFKRCKRSCPRRFLCLILQPILSRYPDDPARACCMPAANRHTPATFRAALKEWESMCLKNPESAFMTDKQRLKAACESIRENNSVQEYMQRRELQVDTGVNAHFPSIIDQFCTSIPGSCGGQPRPIECM